MLTFSRKLVGVFALALLCASMAPGLALADDEDTAAVTLSVTCNNPGNVTMEDIDFGTIESGTPSVSSTATLTVDMGCYLGSWQVDAQMSNFLGGPANFGGFGINWISAEDFSLENGNVDVYFLEPIDLLGFLEPETSDAIFTGDDDVDTILETTTSFLWFLLTGDFDVPAPFTTEATYDANLDLPAVIFADDYEAELTVTLLQTG